MTGKADVMNDSPWKNNLETLYQLELERFRQRIPKSMALHERGKAVMPNGVPVTWMVSLHEHPPIFVAEGAGAYLLDVDGNRYLDMNHADLSMSCGYAHPAIVSATCDQVSRGSQFLLPGQVAIDVSELLAARFGLPKWQYTLSASMANRECIKVARAHTGRERVLVFDGSYHGHIPETLDAVSTQAGHPNPAESVSIPFNDLDALQHMLRTREFALVLLEPAMTNISLVRPEPGFLQGVRQICTAYGTLLLADETHTHVCAWGGLTRAWGIDPDFVVVGKSIAGGIPMGAYGMRDEIATTLERNTKHERWPEEGSGGLALGGTLFGYPLALAATRAVLTEILTPEAHVRTSERGARMADGLDMIAQRNALPWSAFRLYCRSGICFSQTPPRNAAEATEKADFQLNRYQRLFMANRGVWEAIPTSGAAVSFVMTDKDIAFYLEVFERMVKSLGQSRRD
jgi:glutamate-1-semialdehyde 2,1-aminomutase